MPRHFVEDPQVIAEQERLRKQRKQKKKQRKRQARDQQRLRALRTEMWRREHTFQPPPGYETLTLSEQKALRETFYTKHAVEQAVTHQAVRDREREAARARQREEDDQWELKEKQRKAKETKRKKDRENWLIAHPEEAKIWLELEQFQKNEREKTKREKKMGIERNTVNAPQHDTGHHTFEISQWGPSFWGTIAELERRPCKPSTLHLTLFDRTGQKEKTLAASAQRSRVQNQQKYQYPPKLSKHNVNRQLARTEGRQHLSNTESKKYKNHKT